MNKDSEKFTEEFLQQHYEEIKGYLMKDQAGSLQAYVDLQRKLAYQQGFKSVNFRETVVRWGVALALGGFALGFAVFVLEADYDQRCERRVQDIEHKCLTILKIVEEADGTP